MEEDKHDGTQHFADTNTDNDSENYGYYDSENCDYDSENVDYDLETDDYDSENGAIRGGYWRKRRLNNDNAPVADTTKNPDKMSSKHTGQFTMIGRRCKRNARKRKKKKSSWRLAASNITPEACGNVRDKVSDDPFPENAWVMQSWARKSGLFLPVVIRGLIQKFASAHLLNSAIMSDSEIDALVDAGPFGDFPRFHLLFRASVNGFGASEFHKLCDDKGPTLTVVKTEFGQVIGGFTSVPWQCEPIAVWKCDPTAFLFSSRISAAKGKDKKVDLPVIMGSAAKRKDQVCHCELWGPTFGTGRDLFIADGHGASKSCMGSSFVCAMSQSLTEGRGQFHVENYEVFQRI